MGRGVLWAEFNVAQSGCADSQGTGLAREGKRTGGSKVSDIQAIFMVDMLSMSTCILQWRLARPRALCSSSFPPVPQRIKTPQHKNHSLKTNPNQANSGNYSSNLHSGAYNRAPCPGTTNSKGAGGNATPGSKSATSCPCTRCSCISRLDLTPSSSSSSCVPADTRAASAPSLLGVACMASSVAADRRCTSPSRRE